MGSVMRCSFETVLSVDMVVGIYEYKGILVETEKDDIRYIASASIQPSVEHRPIQKTRNIPEAVNYLSYRWSCL